MPDEIMLGAKQARLNEIAEAFDYAKSLALEAEKNRKVTEMVFTLRFEEGYVPTVSHDISEVYA